MPIVNTPYLILTRSRTGSNMFKDYLNSHPKVKSMAELCRTNEGLDIEAMIKKVYDQTDDIDASGFKLFYYHPNDGSPSEIWGRLKDISNLKTISLRRNPLRCSVSSEIMQQSKQHKQEVGDDVVPIEEKRIEVDVNRFLNQIEHIESLRRQLNDNLDTEPYEVWYEDIVADGQAVMDGVFQHLGLNPHPIQTNLQKQNPEGIHELISNYDELRDAVMNRGLFESTEMGVRWREVLNDEQADRIMTDERGLDVLQRLRYLLKLQQSCVEQREEVLKRLLRCWEYRHIRRRIMHQKRRQRHRRS
jgi:LPS sulfotransferase NodH